MTHSEICDLLSFALQADLENGVQWMNEEAGRKFVKDYPELAKAIGQINEAYYDSSIRHRESNTQQRESI